MTKVRQGADVPEDVLAVHHRVIDFLHREAADHQNRDAFDETCTREAAGLRSLATFIEGLPPADVRLQILRQLHPFDVPFVPTTASAWSELHTYASTWPACDHIDSTCALVVGVGLELSADAWLTRFVRAEAERQPATGR